MSIPTRYAPKENRSFSTTIGASSTIDHCVVTGNTAACGGGFSIRASSAQILNTTISNNTSVETGTCFGAPTTTGAGGGMWIEQGSSVTIDWCDIVGNTTNLEGGGIRAQFSAVTIRHTTISGNTARGAGGGGGAFFLGASGSSEEFAGPSAALGGVGESTVLLTNTVVALNAATHVLANGGGIVFSTGTVATVINSTFRDNTAGGFGTPNGLVAQTGDTGGLLLCNSVFWSSAVPAGLEIAVL